MPPVVSRWHRVWSKYFFAARKLKELTVLGALAASIVMVMSPHVVLRTMSYEAFVSIVIAGSAGYVCGTTSPGAGAAQVFGALLTCGVGCAVAFISGSSA